MTTMYLSYLMGGSQILDVDLEAVGAEIMARADDGDRSVRIPAKSLAKYEELITAKLDSGFWNDIVGEDNIIFIFKMSDGAVKRFVLTLENQKEIGALCSLLSGAPIEKTSNVLAYLGGNSLYGEAIHRYVYKHLPRKASGAGGLFLNATGDVLIVKPTYRPTWGIPGGIIDPGETARQAFERETREELGLTAALDAALLSVQYTSDTGFKGDRIHFMFDGGVLDEAQIAAIRLDPGELSEHRFVPLQEAVSLLDSDTGPLVSAAYAARTDSSVVYRERSEHGTK